MVLAEKTVKRDAFRSLFCYTNVRRSIVKKTIGLSIVCLSCWSRQ